MNPSDEGTISFPVDKLKAETLRAIAKDLNLPPVGKKEDVLKRIRTSSSLGWISTTPAKRKADGPETQPPSVGKKPKTPQSIERGQSSSAAESRSPGSASAVSKVVENQTAMGSTENATEPVDVMAIVDNKSVAKPESEVKGELPLDLPKVEDDGKFDAANSPSVKRSTFDDYFVSETTNAFITAGDILNLIAPDFDSYRGTSSLRKAAGSFADPKAEIDARLHFWLIPTMDGDIQNVDDFQTHYQDVLPKKGDKSWYEISVSRTSVQGALKVKLLKGEMTAPPSVTPLESATLEDGAFWVSNPRPASQEDAGIIDQIVCPLP